MTFTLKMERRAHCKCGTRISLDDYLKTHDAGLDDYVRCSECIAMIIETRQQRSSKKALAEPVVEKASKARGTPKGRTQKTRKTTGKLNYQQRRAQAGYCPHCGKYCAPFYECEERREYNRERYWARKKNRQEQDQQQSLRIAA